MLHQSSEAISSYRYSLRKMRSQLLGDASPCRHYPVALGLCKHALVEDTRNGAIVSSINLINQTWSYEGIPFKVGRPELVGTLPDYRQRGLIRKQFEVLHAWSAERGQKLQAITGIPFYYRQFGYEFAVSMGSG